MLLPLNGAAGVINEIISGADLTRQNQDKIEYNIKMYSKGMFVCELWWNYCVFWWYTIPS